MFIHKIAHYIPEKRIPNAYFEPINGLTNEWIESRTGIKERSRAASTEDTNTMAVSAVKELIKDLALDTSEIDLIVGATYTPVDTVATLAHHVQKYLDNDAIPTISISSACSSFVNAVEIVEGYFAMNKASCALVVSAELNSRFANEEDPKAGHLWGDGAAAVLITKERISSEDLKIISIKTGGAATRGEGLTGVNLFTTGEGIVMRNGRDVFINACEAMSKIAVDLLEGYNKNATDVSYLIPHQANFRITQNVMKRLDIPAERVISNIQDFGNTGNAGVAIGLSQTFDKFNSDDLIVISVFGGGYSFGAMLLEK